MSDAGSSTVSRQPFPAVRFFYALGFAIVAWFVFWVLLALGCAQFVIVATNGKTHDEVKTLSANLTQYLWELVAFVCFLRDERPFPFGPFPQVH